MISENNINKIRNLFVSKKYSEVLKLCEKLIAENPEEPILYNFAGVSCQALRDFKNSIIFLKKAIEIDSKNISYLNNLANSYTTIRNYEDAEKVYNKALSINNKNTVILNNFASFQKRVLNYSKAIKLYEKLITLDNKPNILNELADCYQIIGDFEIIGQLKRSFSNSKKKQMVNGFSERLVNAVIQSSKRIKTETELSSGATSVSFASVHYILEYVKDVSQKNILLFGTGKIGRNTCENLIKHTRNDQIVLVNRSEESAHQVAGKFNLVIKKVSELKTEIAKSDIVIVATGSQDITLEASMMPKDKPLMILDLSVPSNVDPKLNDYENITVINLDELSQLTNDALKKREQFIPQDLIGIYQINGKNISIHYHGESILFLLWKVGIKKGK